MSTAEDARYRTKVFLDAYLTAANLTHDDDVALASFIIAYGKPKYSITRIFTDKDVDLIFSIEETRSEALIEYDMYPYGYMEHIPIVIFCIDKPGVSGDILKWKGERELRRICEVYPFGSLRTLTDRTDNDMIIGGTKVYSTRWILNYRRDMG